MNLESFFMKAPFSLKSGIHPDDNKAFSAALPVREIPLPKRLTVSLSMHLGAPAKPIVTIGNMVAYGQRIADAGGFISSPVHAPAAGKIVAIDNAVTPLGRMAPAIVIETEPGDNNAPFHPIDWPTAKPADLIARVAEAGVVGMGGAGFPTNVKLSPPSEKPIDTLILNGAECEPYLTGDHRMMLEHASAIWTGCRIIRKILNTKTIRIAIEDNKPDAIAAMQAAIDAAPESGADVQVVALRTCYPQGAEKQQIYSVTGRKVPAGGLPMDVGCLVENVSTTLAIFNAVVRGLPLTHRVITVSGDAVATPSNLLVPNGTPFAELIDFCGGAKPDFCKLVSGGPMMGFAQADATATTGKTTSGLLLLSASRTRLFTSQACISCGRCVDACPMSLMPTELSQCIEANDIAAAEALNVLDCFECGSCAFVCPAHRPMVQHMRRAKAVILANRKK